MGAGDDLTRRADLPAGDQHGVRVELPAARAGRDGPRRGRGARSLADRQDSFPAGA